MTDPNAAEITMRSDRAEQLLEALRLGNPAEADLQASAMVLAGLRRLQEMRGTPAVLDTLSRLGPALVQDYPAPAQPAPVPSPSHPTDLVGPALAYLRGLPVGQACAEADAVMRAAGTFLRETFERGTPVASVAPAPVPAEHVACALVDQLRALDQGEAHERARGAVTGAAAYLHETLGRTHATALLDGTLSAAAQYGDEVRGGRDSLDTVH